MKLIRDAQTFGGASEKIPLHPAPWFINAVKCLRSIYFNVREQSADPQATLLFQMFDTVIIILPEPPDIKKIDSYFDLSK